MTREQMAYRLQAIFPDFDRTAFNVWWATEQPLLNGLAPSQADQDELVNLIMATESFHASKKGVK